MDHTRNPGCYQPLRRLQWKKEFATRRHMLYSSLDDHLKAEPGFSTVDAFLSCVTSDLEPSRRHAALRSFLGRTGARSFPEALTTYPVDKRILAMVDDRCDPSMGSEDEGNLPLRPWESDQYRWLPPSGLNVRVHGANAEMLYNRLQEKVWHIPKYVGLLNSTAEKKCRRAPDSVSLTTGFGSKCLTVHQIYSRHDPIDGSGTDLYRGAYPSPVHASLSLPASGIRYIYKHHPGMRCGKSGTLSDDPDTVADLCWNSISLITSYDQIGENSMTRGD